MNQTFVLQEVIDDLINIERSVSAPLMKLNYFARLIKNDELLKYTQNELNGYLTEKDKIPPYRKTSARIYITMQAYIHRHKGEIPISMIDEEFRHAFETVYIREGISAVEKLAKESLGAKSNNEIAIPLTMDMLYVLQEPARKLYRSNVHIDVIDARLAGSSTVIIEIPNAIRTKLLELVMSIGESFGFNIEIESFNKRQAINNQTIIHQMSTTINNTGDSNLINAGNENHIENKSSFFKGNFEKLRRELEKNGIEDADINELKEIINAEKPDEENSRLGEKSNGWILGIINKSLNGIGKISTGISSNLLASIIRQYYGMP